MRPEPAAALFRQFFAELPRDLLDAAQGDGASWPRIHSSRVIPISLPVLIGAGLVLFNSAWNAFFWPLMVAPKPELRVIQTAISLSARQVQTRLNENFADALIAAVVPVLFMPPLQRCGQPRPHWNQGMYPATPQLHAHRN